MKESEFIKPEKASKLVTVKIDCRLFPIDLVYTASYAMMDRAYVILDGSPEDVVYALLKPRTFKGDLKELGRMFYDELINAAFHTVQMMRNKEIKDALISSLAPITVGGEDVAELWEDKFGGEVEEFQEEMGPVEGRAEEEE